MLHYLPVEGRHRRVAFFFAFFARGHLRAMSVSNLTQRGKRYKTHIARTGCLIGAHGRKGRPCSPHGGEGSGVRVRTARSSHALPRQQFNKSNVPNVSRKQKMYSFPPPSDKLSERAAMSASPEDGVAMSAYPGQDRAAADRTGADDKYIVCAQVRA